MLVVLAVAEPFLEQRRPELRRRRSARSRCWSSTARTRWPTSRPTRAASIGPSSWPRRSSKRAAGRRLHAGADGRPPSVIVGTPAVEPRDFLEEIDNLKLPHGGGRSAGHARSRSKQILRHGRARGPDAEGSLFPHRPGTQHLGSPSCADKRAEQADTPSIRDCGVDTRLGRSWRRSLVVIDLGQAERREPGRHQPAHRRPVRHRRPRGDARGRGAQFRHASLATHQLVEFYVDGHRVKETYVDVAAGEQAPVSFQLSLRRRRRSRRRSSARARSARHRQPSLALAAGQRTPARAVRQRQARRRGPVGGATDYLAFALDPDESAGERRGSRPA